MDNRQAPLHLLLHVFCERFVPVVYRQEDEDYAMAFHLRCPCKKTHAVNHLGFLLVEKVEGALDSAEQEVDKVSLGVGALEQPWLSSLAARLVRQRSSVKHIEAPELWSHAEGDLEMLLSLGFQEDDRVGEGRVVAPLRNCFGQAFFCVARGFEEKVEQEKL